MHTSFEGNGRRRRRWRDRFLNGHDRPPRAVCPSRQAERGGGRRLGARWSPRGVRRQGRAPRQPRAAAPPKRDGVLKAALTGEPDSLDPTCSQIYTGAQVYDNIFSKLIDIDERPAVLRRPRDQAGSRTTTRRRGSFDLVPDVTFHNGEPFTADDVKYTFERILEPEDRERLRAALRRRSSGRGRRARPRSIVPPEDAVRPVSDEPREQRRDREQEGDRGGKDSGAKPGRHRAVPVRRVGAGRPRHAEALPRLLQEGPAVRSTASSSGSCRRPGPRRRARVG